MGPDETILTPVERMDLARALQCFFWGLLIEAFDLRLNDGGLSIDLIFDPAGWLLIVSAVGPIGRLARAVGLSSMGWLAITGAWCGLLSSIVSAPYPMFGAPPTVAVVEAACAVAVVLGLIGLARVMAAACGRSGAVVLLRRWDQTEIAARFVLLPVASIALLLTLFVGAGALRPFHVELTALDGAAALLLVMFAAGAVAFVHFLVTIHRTRVAAASGRLG